MDLTLQFGHLKKKRRTSGLYVAYSRGLPVIGQKLAKMFYFFAEKKSRRVMLGFNLTFIGCDLCVERQAT